MDSVKLHFWHKRTEDNQNVYTFQIFEGADITILLQFDDVTRFDVELNHKVKCRLFQLCWIPARLCKF